MKNIKYFTQFVFAIIFFIFFKILGPNFSSKISGKLFEKIGPLFRSKKIIYSNIKKALPKICSAAQMILTNTKQNQQFCQKWNPNTRFLQSFDELGILCYSNTIQETIFHSSEKQPTSHLALSGT